MSKENDSLDLASLNARFDLFLLDDDHYGHIKELQLDQSNNSVLVLTNGQPAFDNPDNPIAIENIARGYNNDLDGATLSFDFTVGKGKKQYAELIFPTSFPPAEFLQGAIGTYDDKNAKTFQMEIAGVRDCSYTVFNTTLGNKITRPDNVTDDYPKWSPAFPQAGDPGWQQYPFRMGYYTLALRRLHADTTRNLSEGITDVVIRMYRMDSDKVAQSILIANAEVVHVDTFKGTLKISLHSDADAIHELWDGEGEFPGTPFPLIFTVLLDDVSDTLKGLVQTVGCQPNEFFFWKGTRIDNSL